MGMKGRIYIDGDRFEAMISPDRLLSDILDRKFGKGLVLLRRADLEELGHVTALLQEGEPVLVDGGRYEAYMNLKKTHADILDRRLAGRLIMLDRPALEELGKMIDEILGALVS